MAVTDDRHSVRELASKITQIKDKINYVQIREKTKTARDIITLLEYLEEGGVKKEQIILNDRLDVALLMNIPTVHLPESSLPVKRAKQLFPYIRFGRSVHSYEGARQAEREGADYVLYGHCYETNSKKGRPPNGLQPLIKMKKELNLPLYAIGGITVDNISDLHQVRVDGIGIMSGIFSAENLIESINKINEAINHER
jgi:thiazole tautomerase (transcriptional regulator TenI)